MIPTAPGTQRPIDVLLCHPWRDDSGTLRPSGKGDATTHPDFADLCADILGALEHCRVSLDGFEADADRAERTLRASARIKGYDVTDADVERARRTAMIDAAKGGLPLLVPAACRENRKRKAHVERVTACMIDVDHATDAQWAAAEARLAEAGLAWLAYGSPKDGLTPGEVRRRLVLPTSRDMSVAESERLQRAVPALLGLEADSATYDASRGFYVGAIDGQDPYVAGTDTGAALDVDAILAAQSEPSRPEAPRSKYADARVERRAAPCPAGVAPETHAVTLCRAHTPAVEGAHGGTELLRLARDLVHGLALAPAVAADVAWREYNPRCVPPWRAEQRSEFDRKFSEARQPDGQPPGWLLPGAASIESPALDAPAFVTTRSGKERWHIDPRGGAYAYVQFGDRALHPSLRETGADAYVRTHDGAKRRTAQQMIDEDPTAIAEKVAVDFSRSAAATWAPAQRTIYTGVAAPRVAPRFDANVDTWLRLLAGEQYDSVALFAASCAREFISRPAIALAVLGPDSIGKSLLAKALAAMWDATHPVALSVVLAQFNASMARCPIVLDDECAALKHGDVSTETFRDLVQSEARDIEPKGLERRTLLGCQRFMITGNDETDIRFADADAGALAALGVRLVIVAVPAAKRSDVIAALDRCHVPGSGRVDMLRVTGHLAWLQAEHAPRIGVERFIGEASSDDAVAALMRWRVLEHEALFARLAAVLDGSVAGYADVFVRDGLLLARTDELAARVGLSGARDVRRALGRACGGRVVVKVGAKAVTCAELDALLIARTMRLDVERVRSVLASGAPPSLIGANFTR